MLIARTVVGALLGLVAVAVIASNDYIFVRTMLQRRRAPSWIPLVGGLTVNAESARAPETTRTPR